MFLVKRAAQMKSGNILFSCLIALLLCCCAPTLNTVENIEHGSIVLQLDSTINGMRRTALVHIPRNYREEMAYPLVVVLHGAFSTSEQMERETGFSVLADREDFIVLYPDGMGIFGFVQHWNAGHCCGKAASDGLDDVGFIEECITKVSAKIKIDPKRVYLTGFSNGGMMAYRFAAEKSHEIAAFAALGASVGGRPAADADIWMPPSPEVPVPALIMHGLDDAAVPPLGGVSPRKGGERYYLSLDESVAFWLKANSCNEEPIEKRMYQGIVKQRLWQRCGNQSAVFVVTLDKWGHQWPGPYFIKEDQELAGFDASQVIWQFFKGYPR